MTSNETTRSDEQMREAFERDYPRRAQTNEIGESMRNQLQGVYKRGYQDALQSPPQPVERPILPTRGGMNQCPIPGEECEVSGANSDYNDEWQYTKCVLVAYSPCMKFAWFQVPDCWPFQEKIINCDFKLSDKPLSAKQPVDRSDVVERNIQANSLEAVNLQVGIVRRGLYGSSPDTVEALERICIHMNMERRALEIAAMQPCAGLGEAGE